MFTRPHILKSFLLPFWLGAACTLGVGPRSAAWGDSGPSPTQEARKPSPRGLDLRLEAILRQSRAGRGFWGVEVLDLRSGRILYRRDSDRFFHPASNMKLFTTAAAIESLGPDFIFYTTAESSALPDSEGRVGDLFLVGRGDPNLGGRVLPYQIKDEMREPADAAFHQLADQLVAKGVREAQHLIMDDSYFLFQPYSKGWEEEDLVWGYAAPVTALAFNDNALALRVRAGPVPGAPAEVWTEPVRDYYKVAQDVRTVAANVPKCITVRRQPGSMQLDVWGEVPLGAGGDAGEGTVAIANPPELIGQLFRRALEQRGITVRGQVEVARLTRLDPAARGDGVDGNRIVLAEHASLPLREDVKLINKVSQNLHAEMLARTMGRKLKNSGTLEAGLEVIQEVCEQAGIEADEFRFADGSGLSHHALVTPHAIIKLLRFMARSPRFEFFFESLPVAGVDGTLSERFRGTPAEGRIHAKTGTIDHVNSLSGYMELPTGERLAFSLMGNSHTLDSKGGEQVVDRMALALFNWFARQKRRR